MSIFIGNHELIFNYYPERQRLAVFLKEGASYEDENNSLLVPVWENGKFLKEYSFDEVKNKLFSEIP